MADLTMYYDGNKILETSESGSKTIKTKDKYCVDDISVVYEQPQLESLTNPAGTGDIVSGKEAYDDQGSKITGSYSPPTLPTLTNPASASDIASGKEAIDGQGQKITGTKQEVYDALNAATGSFGSTWAGATEFSSNKIIINAPHVTNIYRIFLNAILLANTELELNTPNSAPYSEMFRNVKNLKKLKLIVDWSKGVGNWAVRMFLQCTEIEEIDCIFDFSTATGLTGAFQECSNLVTLKIAPNTISLTPTNAFFNCTSLSDASIVYIGNGLKDGITGQTLTLHATPKARTLEIMGTVSQITDENQVTYNFFTADEQGSTSLNSFITQTKGWTIA